LRVRPQEADLWKAADLHTGLVVLPLRKRDEPTAIGTRMRFRIHGRPTGAMRITEPILRPMLKRQFRQHCTTLKRVLEQSPPA
jgi:hypothetical protein